MVEAITRSAGLLTDNQDEEIVYKKFTHNIVNILDDGDCVSCRPCFSKEANKECEDRINSVAYILSVEGKMLRNATKDFTLCAYNLTHVSKDVTQLKDIMAKPAKYVI